MSMSDNIVCVCPKCFGTEPCWCGNNKYIRMWQFVYNAFISCKPSI